MRKILIFPIFLLLLSFIPIVSAWQNSTFNNSLSSEFLSFKSPGSLMRFLAVPSGVTLTNGMFNLTYPTGVNISYANLSNNIQLYYEFNSSRELVNGIYNLTSNQGTVIYNNSNCRVGLCGQYAAGMNNQIPPNPFTATNQSFTWNFWFRIANFTHTTEIVLAKASNFGSIGVDNESSWFFQDRFTGTAFTPTTPTLVNGSYYMVTITRDNSNNNVSIYINGAILTSGTASTLNTNVTQLINLGVNYDNGSAMSNGEMDEFGVFNYTAQQSDVTNLYNGGKALSYSTFTGAGSGLINVSIGTPSITSAVVMTNISLGNVSLVLNNLQTNINNYLSTCSYVNNYCNVPFNFSSNVGGVWMLYNNMNFNNTGVIENSQTFSSPVQELSTNTFSINVSYDPNYFASVIGTLVYNNTRYSSSQVSSGTSSIFSTSAIAPAVGGTTNVPFYWEFATNNISDTNYVNSTFKNQSVTTLSVDDCSANNVMILNYTIYDQDSRVKLSSSLNTTFEFTGKIGDPALNNFVSLSFNKSNVNPVTICIQNLNSTLRLDTTAKISADNRVTEYYNIQNYTLTNTSIPVNVSVYDLLITRSQQYLITFQDLNFIPVPDALIDITRNYIPIGQFLDVEIPKTDNSGNAIGHFVSNDEIYTIYVKKNGVLLATYNNIRVFCASAVNDCRINLNQQGSTISPSSFTNNGNISYMSSYNDSTRVYRFDFTALDGIQRLVTLNITKFDNYNNLSLCSSSLTSTSGTLTCTIPSNVNGTAQAKVYVSNTLFLSDVFNIIISNKALLNNSRYIIAAVLVILLPIMGIGEFGIVALILYVVGLILSGFLVVIDWGGWVGPTTALLWFIVATIILIAIETRRKQNV